MSTHELTGSDAFEYVVRRLEETTALLQEKRAVEEANRTLHDEIKVLRRQLDGARERLADREKIGGALTDLWDEADHVRKLLERCLKGGRLRRDVAGEHAADLRRHLDAAKPFTDHIPF